MRLICVAEKSPNGDFFVIWRVYEKDYFCVCRMRWRRHDGMDGLMMGQDAFSKYHPAVNFTFFLGAIGCGVVIRHPAYVAGAVVTGVVYYLLLVGQKGWKLIGGLIPLFLFLTAINPLLNTQGQTQLFYLFGRPYTLEALYYGASIAGMFVSITVWFGCYNHVLTSDKFTSLFGNLIPALSLLLVMVLRLVPTFLRKTRAISGARDAIGKGVGEGTGKKERLESGLTVLGALTSWALEGSVVTGDSMRARGYGCAKRSSFMLYTMGKGDWSLLLVQLFLLALVLLSAFLGQAGANFTPILEVAPVSWGMAVYGAYLLIPTVLQIKESILWHISRSRI